jgi:hypothetical protein
MRGSELAITISKSKYMAGVQCLKRLYLLVHRPELGHGKTAADFARFDQGRQVGKLAQQLFASGVEIRTGNPEEAIRTTQELIANPDIPAIFEAAFEHDGVFVRVDILHRRRDGRWRLIEVKSSASMKDEHVEDVAIQYRIVSNCGVDVVSCHLATVNRQYVFPGGEIDPWRFFRIRNVTRRVRNLQPKLAFQLRSEFRVLAMSEAPDLQYKRLLLGQARWQTFRDLWNSLRYWQSHGLGPGTRRSYSPHPGIECPSRLSIQGKPEPFGIVGGSGRLRDFEIL